MEECGISISSVSVIAIGTVHGRGIESVHGGSITGACGGEYIYYELDNGFFCFI